MTFSSGLNILFKKNIVLLSFSLGSTVYIVYEQKKGHRKNVSSALREDV